MLANSVITQLTPLILMAYFTFQNEAASLRAELGSLRAAAEDAEKAKESLRSDNTRLTHRISYLEEQVAELLSRHTQVRQRTYKFYQSRANFTKHIRYFVIKYLSWSL